MKIITIIMTTKTNTFNNNDSFNDTNFYFTNVSIYC